MAAACSTDGDSGAPEVSSSTSTGSTGGEDSTSTEGGSTSQQTSVTATGSAGTGEAGTESSADSGTSSSGSGTSASGSGDTSSSSTSGGGEVAVQVQYSFVTDGETLSCDEAGVTWVDVYVTEMSNPRDDAFNRIDLDCDDELVSIGPLPVGDYEVQVIAWDQTLWTGEATYEVDEIGEGLLWVVPLAALPM